MVALRNSDIDIQTLSPAQQTALWPEKARADYIQSLSEEDAEILAYTWRGWWARPKQLLPELTGDWDIWCLMAGRGFGKTKSGAEGVIELVKDHGYRSLALVGRTTADVRDTMVLGPSGLLTSAPPWFRPHYEPSKRLITFPNGAVAHTYSADKPDSLRGPNFDLVWADELPAWRYPDAWNQAQLALRIGKRPISIVTTTPRPTKIMREVVQDDWTHLITGTTYENADNLAGRSLDKYRRKYEGTRLGRQELLAELLSDTPGALWTLAIIEDTRVESLPPLKRIVIGVDPQGASSDEENATETGIIVAGIGYDDHGYVIADYSINETPAKWGEAVVDAYVEYEADCIVGEVNNGGEMVEFVVQAAGKAKGMKRVNFKSVRASRGKQTRAEPISAFYERNEVSHLGVLSELEDQLTTWVPGDKSPDRLDASVWALTELMVDDSDAPPEYKPVVAKRRRLRGTSRIN